MAERDRKSGLGPRDRAGREHPSQKRLLPRREGHGKFQFFLDMGCPLARRYPDAARLPAWDNLVERRHT